MSQQDDRKIRDDLKERIATLLDGSLGLNIFGSATFTFGSKTLASFFATPWGAALRISVLYVLFLIAIPWLVSFIPFAPQPTSQLFVLQIYGSFWAGWATLTTHLASSPVQKILDNEIIPQLSAKTAKAIDKDIQDRFNSKRLLWVSWAIGVSSAILAGCLIHHDTKFKVPSPSTGAIIWWSVGWAVLFTTAAKVVSVGRFYRLFAAHLQDSPEKLYALGPARSALVTSIASVAKIMLLFWFGIAVSIALAIPFGVREWTTWSPSINFSSVRDLFISLYNDFIWLDPHNNWFVLVEVPVAYFFSIGIGTIVFLRSEFAIEQAVRGVVHSMLHSIESQVASLSGELSTLADDKWKRLTELNTLHKDVTGAGSYRSFILSGLSIMAPFVIPVISLFMGRAK